MAEAAQQLQSNTNALMPMFNEQPMLQLNNMAMQIPWITAFQNNMVAAVNNLRRVGAKGGKVKSETQLIELNLAKAFEAAGVKTLSGFHPTKCDGHDAGEIDLICAQGSCVLVIEIKSSYIRGSKKGLWLHETNGLLKAGTQILAKISGVQRQLRHEHEFRAQLGLQQSDDVNVTSLIVETSMISDHNYNYVITKHGFLAVNHFNIFAYSILSL